MLRKRNCQVNKLFMQIGSCQSALLKLKSLDMTEQDILPKCGELQIEGEEVFAEMLDAELDNFKCTFQNDRGIHIDTEGLTYLALSLDNLKTMENLAVKAQEYFDDKYSKEKT